MENQRKYNANALEGMLELFFSGHLLLRSRDTKL